MQHPQMLHKNNWTIFKLDLATPSMSQYTTQTIAMFKHNIVGRINGAFGHAIASPELHSSVFSLEKRKKSKKKICWCLWSPHDRVVVLTDGFIQPVACRV